jgi:1,4-dihydroxy-6-naphthoate synthase
MVWAVEAGAVDLRGLELELVVSDIQSLNEWAQDGRLEVTALSAGAYPAVEESYVLLPHGASFGEGYGPIVVARGEVDLSAVEIVTPGPLTSAERVVQLAGGEAIRTAVDSVERADELGRPASPLARVVAELPRLLGVQIGR